MTPEARDFLQRLQDEPGLSETLCEIIWSMMVHNGPNFLSGCQQDLLNDAVHYVHEKKKEKPFCEGCCPAKPFLGVPAEWDGHSLVIAIETPAWEPFSWTQQTSSPMS